MRRVGSDKQSLGCVLREEMAALTSEHKKVYENYAVAPYEQRCSRNADSGSNACLAQQGFDDVEEDFWVGVPDDDAILERPRHVSPLVTTLLELDRIVTIR